MLVAGLDIGSLTLFTATATLSWLAASTAWRATAPGEHSLEHPPRRGHGHAPRLAAMPFLRAATEPLDFDLTFQPLPEAGIVPVLLNTALVELL